jgi:N6-adenosine-specific RNA methylase IME4
VVLVSPTRDKVAEKVGMKARTFEKAKTVWDKAKSGDEVAAELVKKVDAKDYTINRAYTEIKRQEKKEERQQDIIDNPPLPDGRYNVIYADPPWKYEFSETHKREIENQYPTMGLEEIIALQLPIEENAVLLLWTTAPKLEESLQVLNAWGFTYRTCAIWDKEKLGMGYWFRIQHEILLVGIKGEFRAPEPEDRIPSIIRAAREEHSKKPEIMYKIIEKMFPNKKYLEVFSRSNHHGWVTWGNQPV